MRSFFSGASFLCGRNVRIGPDRSRFCNMLSTGKRRSEYRASCQREGCRGKAVSGTLKSIAAESYFSNRSIRSRNSISRRMLSTPVISASTETVGHILAARIADMRVVLGRPASLDEADHAVMSSHRVERIPERYARLLGGRRCAAIMPGTEGIVSNSPSRCMLRSHMPITSTLLPGKHCFM